MSTRRTEITRTPKTEHSTYQNSYEMHITKTPRRSDETATLPNRIPIPPKLAVEGVKLQKNAQEHETCTEGGFRERFHGGILTLKRRAIEWRLTMRVARESCARLLVVTSLEKGKRAAGVPSWRCRPGSVRGRCGELWR
jgi:hypothetical protein